MTNADRERLGQVNYEACRRPEGVAWADLRPEIRETLCRAAEAVARAVLGPFIETWGGRGPVYQYLAADSLRAYLDAPAEGHA